MKIEISDQKREAAPRLVIDLYDEVIGILHSNGNVPKTRSVPLGMLMLAHYAKQGKIPPREADRLVEEVFAGGENLHSWEAPRICRDARSFNRWLDETLRANGFRYYLCYECQDDPMPIAAFSKCLCHIKTDHDLERMIKRDDPCLGYTYYWMEALAPWHTRALQQKGFREIWEGALE